MTWQPQSVDERSSTLFLRSEFIFWREHSIVEDIGDAVIIVTPENPFWRWGNLIVLKNPPRVEDSGHWRKLFEEKIAPLQSTPDRVIVWEGELGDMATLDPYISDGLMFSGADVLLLGALKRPAMYNANIEIREIHPDANDKWEEVLAANIEAFGTEENISYMDYASRRFMHHRSQMRKGAGRWYGAYVDSELAGNLGIFAGDGLCRFQEVAVGRKFRRQGVASALVYHAAANAREEYPDNPQIIIAFSGGDAINVYRKIGFEKHSESYALITRR